MLGIKEEERAMAEVWKAVKESHEGEQDESRKVEVDLTSGYFGLYKKYKQLVVESPAAVRIIAASPKVKRSCDHPFKHVKFADDIYKANGFYGSKGFSRLIPEGYTLLESRFHQDTVRAGRAWDMEKVTGVRLKEWEREGWTYHSKGL